MVVGSFYADNYLNKSITVMEGHRRRYRNSHHDLMITFEHQVCVGQQ